MKAFRAFVLFAAIALPGCALLNRPVYGPGGQQAKNPDGSDRVVYDEVVETGGTVLAVLFGNPLIMVLTGAGGLLARDLVVKRRG